jgi:hypothetical protein
MPSQERRPNSPPQSHNSAGKHRRLICFVWSSLGPTAHPKHCGQSCLGPSSLRSFLQKAVSLQLGAGHPIKVGLFPSDCRLISSSAIAYVSRADCHLLLELVQIHSHWKTMHRALLKILGWGLILVFPSCAVCYVWRFNNLRIDVELLYPLRTKA